MKVEEKVALDAIKHDAKSHIEVHAEACARCAAKPCLRACPAQLYTLEPETGAILVDHTGCLECGTCLVVCKECGLTWTYPAAGFGVRYRYG